jgi:hypothetical protein
MKFHKDLLFTDKHLIKGHIKTGGQRLSTFLNSTRKKFLEMEEALLISHDGKDRIKTDFALVRINEILFAYENEETGDEVMRNLGGRQTAEQPILIHLNSTVPLQLSGKVRKRALESEAIRWHDFFVIMNPVLNGFSAKPAPEYSFIKNVPYLIVNRDRSAIMLS